MPAHESLRPGRRVTTLLAAATVGTYVLVLAGVSDALAGAAAVCPTWPVCGARVDPTVGPRLAVVAAHRFAAVAVATLLVAATVAAVRRGVGRRVLAAIAVALASYPVEVWLGARTARSGASAATATVHLVVAMTIFSALMAALVWHLDADAAETPDRRSATTPGAASARSTGRDRAAATDGPLARLRAYVRLTKPKLWWLLCLVALASMGLAAGRVPPLGTVVATLTGGVLAVGASGTFNNVVERDRDERMARTDDRPVVTDAVSPGRALAFGAVLTAASVAVFVAFVNALAAGLGLLAVLYYSVVYTLVLKPNTDKNTVVGGAVGALPALIGWAAVTGGVGLPAVALGAVVFLWTPAHFYNLALVHRADYERAGFPMLPVVRGARVTRRHVGGYLGATLVAAVVLGTDPSLGPVYAAVAVTLGAVFLRAVVRLDRERSTAAARRAFMASNAYLGALLAAVVVDAMVV